MSNAAASAAAAHHLVGRCRLQAVVRRLSDSPVLTLERCVHAEVTNHVPFSGDKPVSVKLEFQPIVLITDTSVSKHDATVRKFSLEIQLSEIRSVLPSLAPQGHAGHAHVP